ncbi:hypothetical protein ACQ4LE_001646 [Meloidogyne hapla]
MSPSSGKNIYKNFYIFNLNKIFLLAFSLLTFTNLFGIYGEEIFLSSNQKRILKQQKPFNSSFPSFSSSSFVLADPNFSQSAYSPPAEPNPILASEFLQNDDEIEINNIPFPSLEENQKIGELSQNKGEINQNYGIDTFKNDKQMDIEKQKVKELSNKNNNFGSSEGLTKKRQFSQYTAAGMSEIPTGIGNPLPSPASACPGGPPLPIECDPKRPWPQCPPQSYCYATNSVDIGPYFCCPVWSTYGAAWRPATPFYNYIPPPPPNWPEPMQMAASPRYGPFRKNLKVNYLQSISLYLSLYWTFSSVTIKGVGCIFLYLN